jgi:hypothetical protein
MRGAHERSMGGGGGVEGESPVGHAERKENQEASKQSHAPLQTVGGQQC